MPTSDAATHPFHKYMLAAAHLAEYGKGKTAPNPAVGALLVQNDKIVAQGWHQKAGSPHAEINAMADAHEKGVDLSSCTLVVTLEPCSHYGKTPPCAKAIVDAGIRHVIIGAADPTPLAGGGAQYLKEHGIHVETGIARKVCEELIRDFCHWQKSPYPYTLLKLASTLDGRIATRTGSSKWITGKPARERVHALRARSDGILIGGNTFRKDNPRLTCRHPFSKNMHFPGEMDIFSDEQPHTLPCEKNFQRPSGQPKAIILTSTLPKTHEPYFLLQKRPAETIFLTPADCAFGDEADALRKLGVAVIGIKSIEDGLMLLRKQFKVYTLLCEGGGRLGMTLLEKGLANEFEWHMAPKILGDEQAIPLFSGRHPLEIQDALQLALKEYRPLGEDGIFLFTRPEAT